MKTDGIDMEKYTAEQKRQIAEWEAREQRYATEPIEQALTDAEKKQLKGAILTNGKNAWEYIKSEPKEIQRWVSIAILSCIKHGWSLNKLTINWELRDLRFADNPKYRR